MKASVLVALLLILVSCGKNNKSGGSDPAPASSPIMNPLTPTEEFAIRDEFKQKSRQLLRVYSDEMRRVIGPRKVTEIRNRLATENFQVTVSIRDCYDQRIGNGHQYDRAVMNILLLIGEISDPQFRLTDRILSRRF